MELSAAADELRGDMQYAVTEHGDLAAGEVGHQAGDRHLKFHEDRDNLVTRRPPECGGTS